ncbi:E3 ubiquitin-protein ligase RNF25 [Petromyzon marinus]|uniref:E3 ubiquitin-protein ligase RNF25 n=1 Tax=Petromyzon marinus TaxID=7757 RepID=UPI003F700A93
MTVTHEDGRPHPWQVTVHLAPATGEDPALGFVRLSLHLQLQHSYPCSTPLITISNPRGFSEQQIDGLVETLRILAQEQLGSAVLFQLVQVAKEALTTINSHPYGACTICLYSLQESEAFVWFPVLPLLPRPLPEPLRAAPPGRGEAGGGGGGPGRQRPQRHGGAGRRHGGAGQSREEAGQSREGAGRRHGGEEQRHEGAGQRHGGEEQRHEGAGQRHEGAGQSREEAEQSHKGAGKERWGGQEATNDEVVRAPCPVCRAEMELKIVDLQNAEEPLGPTEEPWVPDERERQRREETERGLRRQRERGGTVDTQTERGAFVISLATPTRVEESPITLELSAPPQPISTEDTDSSPSSQQQRYRPHHRPHHRRHHQQPMRGDDADRRGYLPANHSGHNWMRGGDGWRRPANQREPFGRAANQRRGLPPFSGAIGSEESLTNQETGCWEDPHEPTNRRAVSSTMLLANRGRARANRSHPFTERTANQSPASSHLANEDVESSVANENIASSQSANDDVASSVANENVAALQSAKEDVASSKVANDSPAVSQSANQSAASSEANQIEGTYCGSSSQDNQNSPSLLSSPLTNERLEYSVANEIGASSSGNHRPLSASANHRRPGFSPANHRARLSANPKPAYTLANQNPGVAAGNRSKASSMANHSEEHYSTNHRQVCATANRRPVSSANQRPACSSTNQNSSVTANQKPAYSSANHRQDCSSANQSSAAPVANRSSAFLSANRNMDSATTMSGPSSSSANQKLAYSATNRRIVPSSTNQRPAYALANPESLSTNCSEEHQSTNHKPASARANDRPACLSANDTPAYSSIQRPPHCSLTNQRPAHSSLANQRAAQFSSANQRPAFEAANSGSRGRGRGGNVRGQAGPRACWDNSYDASGGRAASDFSIERRADM